MTDAYALAWQRTRRRRFGWWLLYAALSYALTLGYIAILVLAVFGRDRYHPGWVVFDVALATAWTVLAIQAHRHFRSALRAYRRGDDLQNPPRRDWLALGFSALILATMAASL